MRLRRNVSLKSALVGLGLALSSISASATPIVFTWKTTGTTSTFGTAANWTNAESPSSGSDLVFESSNTSGITIMSSVVVNRIEFSSNYEAYTFSPGSAVSLGIGTGGMVLGSSGKGTVTFASGLGIQLNDSQTWSVNGPLVVNSIISASSTGHDLTKTGSGTLTLNGANTFNTGLTISEGTLILGSNTGAGTGTLTLANGTTLTSDSNARTIANHVHVTGANVQFSTSSSSGDLTFTESTEFYFAGTTTIASGGARVQFANLTTNTSSSRQLVFTGDNAFVLGGSVAAYITSITAGNSETAGGVLFGNSNAVHSNLTISGAHSGSYVGVVDSAFTSNTHLGTFLSRISASTFAGTLGFDSPSTSSPLTYLGGTGNAIDLSGFTDSNFQGIGSGTYAVIDSSAVITPPSGGTLKLSGVRGGILKVAAPLSTGNSVNTVRINDNAADTTVGAVILSSSSSNYTGSTQLKAGYLLFGASSTGSAGSVTSGPIGTGGLGLESSGTGYLAATTSGLTLHNAIVLGSEASSTLKVGISTSTPSAIASLGNNTFTLAGLISGGGSTKVYIQNKDGAITLSGANNYTGSTDIASASLIAASATALGQRGDVNFQGSSLLTIATPTLSVGRLDSAASTNSTIALGSNKLDIDQYSDGTYRGTITGTGTGTDSVIKGGSGTLTLASATTYTGGTTINGGKVILASGATLGASSSSITLNGGSLIANAGATVSNPLTLNSGSSIGGAGTFATNISVGTGVTLSPGSSPGTMTFSNGLTFASGGTLDFEINNATGTAGASSGWDLLSISGAAAQVTSTSGSPFTIKIKSLTDQNVAGAAANFSASNTYAWTFATTTQGVSYAFNSNLASFAVDRTGFTNTAAGQFFVSQSGNDLLLNFTPVPEPSTYVLMGTGLSLLAGAAWRRRRQR